jgi:hypothetical protein
MNLPSLLELCEVFKRIFMLFHKPEIGSNYFRSDMPLGTGMACTLLGHGIIFIFRSIPNLRGSDAPPSPTLGPRDSLFHCILFLPRVMSLYEREKMCWVKAGEDFQNSRGLMPMGVLLMFSERFPVISRYGG